MSWNLLIHNDGEPLGDIGDVTRKFAGAFYGLLWESPTEAVLPVDGGFRLELKLKEGVVQDIWTNGGFHHIKELAVLCKHEGWLIADAQEGEDIDLDDPLRWYDERQ